MLFYSHELQSCCSLQILLNLFLLRQHIFFFLNDGFKLKKYFVVNKRMWSIQSHMLLPNARIRLSFPVKVLLFICFIPPLFICLFLSKVQQHFKESFDDYKSPQKRKTMGTAFWYKWKIRSFCITHLIMNQQKCKTTETEFWNIWKNIHYSIPYVICS